MVPSSTPTRSLYVVLTAAKRRWPCSPVLVVAALPLSLAPSPSAAPLAPAVSALRVSTPVEAPVSLLASLTTSGSLSLPAGEPEDEELLLLAAPTVRGGGSSAVASARLPRPSCGGPRRLLCTLAALHRRLGRHGNDHLGTMTKKCCGACRMLAADWSAHRLAATLLGTPGSACFELRHPIVAAADLAQLSGRGIPHCCRREPWAVA